MKPLTIDELKAIKVGDWVWIVDDILDGNGAGRYVPIKSRGFSPHPFYNNSFEEYGKLWIAYKNKEEAEGKSINLPCKVGDIIYSIIDKQIFDCKVCMVFQKADKTWHFRFSYRKFVTRNPWIENPKYEWVTYQHECAIDDFGIKVFTDKVEAEHRLAELKGE